MTVKKINLKHLFAEMLKKPCASDFCPQALGVQETRQKLVLFDTSLFHRLREDGRERSCFNSNTRKGDSKDRKKLVRKFKSLKRVSNI